MYREGVQTLILGAGNLVEKLLISLKNEFKD